MGGQNEQEEHEEEDYPSEHDVEQEETEHEEEEYQSGHDVEQEDERWKGVELSGSSGIGRGDRPLRAGDQRRAKTSWHGRVDGRRVL